MRAAFGFNVPPYGKSQVLSVGGVQVVRNIFLGPDKMRHRTYEAAKATFPTLGEAIDAAKKEAAK
jgi:hypothetical protein